MVDVQSQPVELEWKYGTEWIVWFAFLDDPQRSSCPAIGNWQKFEGRAQLSVGKATGEGFGTIKNPVHNGITFASGADAAAYAITQGLLNVSIKESSNRVLTEDAIERMSTELTGESTATRKVAAHLLWERERMGSSYWEIMEYGSVEEFKDSCNRILGDQTEIRGDHLQEADWPSLYKEFKSMKEQG